MNTHTHTHRSEHLWLKQSIAFEYDFGISWVSFYIFNVKKRILSITKNDPKTDGLNVIQPNFSLSLQVNFSRSQSFLLLSCSQNALLFDVSHEHRTVQRTFIWLDYILSETILRVIFFFCCLSFFLLLLSFFASWILPFSVVKRKSIRERKRKTELVSYEAKLELLDVGCAKSLYVCNF